MPTCWYRLTWSDLWNREFLSSEANFQHLIQTSIQNLYQSQTYKFFNFQRTLLRCLWLLIFWRHLRLVTATGVTAVQGTKQARLVSTTGLFLSSLHNMDGEITKAYFGTRSFTVKYRWIFSGIKMRIKITRNVIYKSCQQIPYSTCLQKLKN